MLEYLFCHFEILFQTRVQSTAAETISYNLKISRGRLTATCNKLVTRSKCRLKDFKLNDFEGIKDISMYFQ